MNTYLRTLEGEAVTAAREAVTIGDRLLVSFASRRVNASTD